MAPDTAAFRLVGEHYVSDVGGLFIAWDTCGYCLLHITICNCREPSEPAYLAKLRNNGRLVTPVTRDTEAPNGGARPRRSQGLSIADLVDDSVIAKVKAARQ